ncbi:hypothetical protein GN956_G5678 [Arapaima gigas]
MQKGGSLQMLFRGRCTVEWSRGYEHGTATLRHKYTSDDPSAPPTCFHQTPTVWPRRCTVDPHPPNLGKTTYAQTPPLQILAQTILAQLCKKRIMNCPGQCLLTKTHREHHDKTAE